MGADIVMPAVQIKVVMQMKSAELNARTSLVCLLHDAAAVFPSSYDAQSTSSSLCTQCVSAAAAFWTLLMG